MTRRDRILLTIKKGVRHINVRNILKNPKIYQPIILGLILVISFGVVYANSVSTKIETSTEGKNIQKNVNLNKNDSADNNLETAEESVRSAEATPTNTTTPKAPSGEQSALGNTTVQTRPPAQSQIPKANPTPPPVASPNTVISSGVLTLIQAQDFIEDEVLRLVNAERASKGLSALSFDTKLRQAADIRVGEESIISFSGINHNRPDGSSFSTVLAEVGYAGATMWGENLVWGYQSTITFNEVQLKALADKMFTNWKNSPGHYANMIKAEYNQTGIGVSLINQNGRTYWFAAQLFTRK